MKRLLGALILTTIAFGCRGASAPPDEKPDYFEPASYGTAETATQDPGPTPRPEYVRYEGPYEAGEIPWLDSRGKPVWFHPLEEHTPSLYWEYFPRPAPNDPGGIRPYAEQAALWGIKGSPPLARPWIVADGLDKDLAYTEHWVGLSGPFEDEYLHLFQAPVDSDRRQLVSVYVMDDYLFRLRRWGSLLVAFVPSVESDAFDSELPPRFQPLFPQDSRVPIDVIQVFPRIEKTYWGTHDIVDIDTYSDSNHDRRLEQQELED